MFDEQFLLVLVALVNRATEFVKLNITRFEFTDNVKQMLVLLSSMIVGVFLTLGFQINLLTMFPGFAGINAFAGQVASGIALAGGGAVVQALIDLRRPTVPPVIVDATEGNTTVATTQTTDNVQTTTVEQSEPVSSYSQSRVQRVDTKNRN